jgi:hypothetical protein
MSVGNVLKGLLLFTALLGCEAAFSMSSDTFLGAVAFSKGGIECRKKQIGLAKEAELGQLFRPFFAYDEPLLQFLKQNGLESRLYSELSGVLPIRLFISEMQKVLSKCCPGGVFSDLDLIDFSIVSRLFPTSCDLESYKVASNVNILSCLASIIRPVVDRLGLKATGEGVRDLLLNIPIDIADYLNKDNISRPFYMDNTACMEAVRRLLPEGMFHNFNDTEILFITHLFPKNSKMSKIDSNFFMECILGVMRTLVVRDFRSNVSNRNLLKWSLDSGFNVSLPTLSQVLHISDKASSIIRSKYVFERLSPSFERFALSHSISCKDKIKINDIFKEVAYSDHVRVEKDLAFRVWSSLAPHGMFHAFSQPEIILLNLMQPLNLDTNDRLIWMEWLVGSYRSMFLNRNISMPLSGQFVEFVNSFDIGEVVAGHDKTATISDIEKRVVHRSVKHVLDDI